MQDESRALNAFKPSRLDDDIGALSSWYWCSTGTRIDATKAAYDDAIQSLKREFAGKPGVISWIGEQTTATDVLNEIKQAEASYKSQRDGQKILPWLRSTSTFVLAYREVLDALAQHHPEYVSLAWGMLKFVLMGIRNHEKLVHEFSVTLSEITNTLPRAEFIASLYITDRTRAALSKVYAHVLVFLRRAVRWYARSSAGRAVCAIFSPFSLKCEEIIGQIRACVKAIEDEASVSSKAEIRAIHIEVLRHGDRLTEIERRIDGTTLAQSQRWDTINQHMIEVKTTSCAAIEKLEVGNAKLDNVQIDTQDIRSKITDVQATVTDTRTRILHYEEVIQSLAPRTSPEDILSKQQSIIKRAARGYGKGVKHTELIRQVGDWVLSKSPPLMILHAGPRARAQSREIVTELIGILRPSVSQIFWSFHREEKEAETWRQTMLRDLLYQVMKTTVSTASTKAALESSSLDLEQLKNISTEEDIMEMLGHLTRSFPRCFFIVDADDLIQEEKFHSNTSVAALPSVSTLSFFERMLEKCRTTNNTCDARLLVLSSCDDLATLAEDNISATVARMQWSSPPPPAARAKGRLAIRTRSEKMSWAGIQKGVSDMGK